MCLLLRLTQHKVKLHFINPNDTEHVLQSNNSTQNPVGQLYGANYFYSFDFGQTWGGSIQGAGGTNSGDPTTAINLNGRQFVGYIHSNGGRVSYSDNGTTWTPVICAYASGGGLLDKIICGLTTALQAPPLLAICITHGLTFTGQTTTILK